MCATLLSRRDDVWHEDKKHPSSHLQADMLEGSSNDRAGNQPGVKAGCNLAGSLHKVRCGLQSLQGFLKDSLRSVPGALSDCETTFGQNVRL